MHPSAEFVFARVAQEYAAWTAVDAEARSAAPGWWWGPALTLRNVDSAMPPDDARRFNLPEGARFSDAARLILGAMSDQATQPWPSDFPEKFSPKIEDPAASAEPAAQAASAAVVPIA